MQKIKDDEIKAEQDRLIEADPTLSPERAKSMARLNIAKKNGILHRTIKGVKKAMKPKSETAEVLADLTKSSMIAGLGFVAGVGIYGTGGDIATAIAGGAATTSAFSEFMKNSKKTISSGVIRNLENITSSKEEAIKFTQNVDINRDKYSVQSGQEGANKLKELLKEIVKDAGLDSDNEKISQNIDTTINQIQNSPQVAPTLIKQFVTNLSSMEGFNPDKEKFENPEKGEDGEPKGSVNRARNLANGISIAQQITNAESAGISVDDIIEDISDNFDETQDKEFSANNTAQTIHSVVSKVSYAKQIEDVYTEVVEEGKNGEPGKTLEQKAMETLKTERDVINLNKELEKQKDDLIGIAEGPISELYFDPDKEENVQEAIQKYRNAMREASKKVEAQRLLLVGKMLAESNMRLTQEGIELARECQNQLNTLIETGENSGNMSQSVISKLKEVRSGIETKIGPQDS